MEPVAVIGIGCRFPGAHGPAEFWRLLRNEIDAIREIPAGRWTDLPFAQHAETIHRRGGFLDRIDGFDAGFFGISTAEAEGMDPQQRLLLETAWEALEDAGQCPEKLEGSGTGVFAGITYFDYGNLRMSALSGVDGYLGTGVALAIAANRISYFFDFHGPSMSIDTACSSSGVAVYQAMASMDRGECDLALAGGVSLMVSPASQIFMAKAGVLSPHGRCSPMDARADGIVRGEGAGILVLKRLEAALRDHDRIYATLIGGAVNQDGRSNGLSAPNGTAQEALLRQAYANAAVSPASLSYVELHGTGTPLGDPIEARALGVVLAEGRAAGTACLAGSVKSNIGHLEAAAAAAGLIKLALMFHHRAIPASLHFENANPHIGLERLPLRIAKCTMPWTAEPGPAVAGISSFGLGGTNVHLVLREAPRWGGPSEPAAHLPRLLPLSARTPEGLSELAGRFAEYLEQIEDSPALRDICYSAGARRGHHDHRLAVIGRDCRDLAQQLRACAAGGAPPAVSCGQRRLSQPLKVLFVLTGSDEAQAETGLRALAEEPAFAQAVECCGPVGNLRALQIGLTALWRSWGIVPAATIGHGTGEKIAPAPGAITLEIGPDAVLANASSVPVLPSLCHGRDALETLLASLGALYVRGAQVNWEALEEPGARFVPLPSYPWQHRSYWLPQSPEPTPAAKTFVAETLVDRDRTPYVDDHVIRGACVFPGAAFIEAVVRAAAEWLDADCLELTDTHLSRSLVPAEARQIRLRVELESVDRGETAWRIASLSSGEWILHASGRLRPAPAASIERESWDAAVLRCSRPVDAVQHYGALAACGFEYGPSLRPARDIRRGQGEAVAVVALPEDAKNSPMPPPLADSSLHLLTAAFSEAQWREAAGGTFLPDAATRVLVRVPLPARLRAHSVLTESGSGGFAGDVTYFDEQGQCMLEIQGLRVRRLDRGADTVRCYQTEWKPVNLPHGPGREIVFASEPAWRAAIASGRSSPIIWVAPSRAAEPAEGAKQCVASFAAFLRDVRGSGADAAIWIVTQGAQSAGEEQIRLEHAPLWGLARSLSQEHPELWGGILDVPRGSSAETIALLARQAAAQDAEDMILFRGAQAYAPRLSPSDRDVIEPPRLRPDASYLVTGGTGGVGLALARRLAECGARRLFLLSRRGLPPRAQWSSIPETTFDGERIAGVRQLESLGVDVHVPAVNCADAGELKAFLDRLRAEAWPPIRGVVHAAGVAVGGPLRELDAPALDAVFAAKVRGAFLLDRLLAEAELDFFVLVSSAASLLPSHAEGLAAYAAANAFLDGLAVHRRALGRRATAINWGPWEDTGVSKGHDQLFRSGEMGLLAPLHAASQLDRALTNDSAQFAVLNIEWPRWQKSHPRAASRPFVSGLVRPGLGRNSSNGGGAGRLDSMEEFLAGLVAEHLPEEGKTLDWGEPLFALGVDSLAAAGIRNRIEIELGISFSIVQIIEAPSIRALARQIAAKMETQGVRGAAMPARPSPEQIAELSSEQLDSLIEQLLEEQETRN
ncbi:MAG: SDR family NAD(P)-dependent oxidoreductase [Acidobacteriia bacterium]|nr:SDR family NAD(P)-dependent oxidoreductase [Terriglobia bacterium]